MELSETGLLRAAGAPSWSFLENFSFIDTFSVSAYNATGMGQQDITQLSRYREETNFKDPNFSPFLVGYFNQIYKSDNLTPA